MWIVFSGLALLLVFVFTTLFLKLHKPLGGTPNKEQRKAFEQLEHYRNGKFTNSEKTDSTTNFSNLLAMAKKSIFSRDAKRMPAKEPPMAAIDTAQIAGESDSLTWFGHSAFLLSIDKQKILIDPMLGPRPSPVSFTGGSKRYNKNLLDLIPELPPLDAVFLTHDHYDHLDYESIVRLKDKVGRFLVPLGVGTHLIRWGIESTRITELDWWDEAQFGSLTAAFTPSRHFSGRGTSDGNSTLWGGWVLLGSHIRLYISGDGGYGNHFKDIGEKYGPFDLTLLEGGQYDELWKNVHMTPEQSVQAHLDVKGDTMLLSHWGAFTLAFHGWTDPIERAIPEAERLGVPLIVPKIGETIPLHTLKTLSSTSWWKT